MLSIVPFTASRGTLAIALCSITINLFRQRNPPEDTLIFSFTIAIKLSPALRVTDKRDVPAIISLLLISFRTFPLFALFYALL
jgi:hypothetical protein